MPIIGRTDVLPKQGQKLSEIGRIYKGAPQIEKTRTDGTKYKVVGPDLNYFRIELNERYKHLSLAVHDFFGPRPTKFDFVFLAGGDSVDEVFPTWYESHTATKMQCRCDGETIQLWLHPEGYTSNIPKPCDGKKDDFNDWSCSMGCRTVARLNIIPYEFCVSYGVWGYFRITLGAYHEIDEIIFPVIANTFVTFGRLWNIPFNFGRADREINMRARGKNAKPGDRVNVTKSLCYIDVNPDYMKRVLLPTAYTDAQPSLLPSEVKNEHLALPDEIDGEIVDSESTEGESAVSWDVAAVVQKTAWSFGSPDEQSAFIDGLLVNGTLRDDMTTEQVVGAINFALWNSPGWQTEFTVNNYLTACDSMLGVSKKQALIALAASQAYYTPDSPPVRKIEGFAGTKADAWAAAVAFYMHYDAAAPIPEKLKLGTDVQAKVLELCTALREALDSKFGKK